MESKKEQFEKDELIISNLSHNEQGKIVNNVIMNNNNNNNNSNDNNYSKLNETISIVPKPVSDEKALPILATSVAIKKIVDDRTEKQEKQTIESVHKQPAQQDTLINQKDLGYRNPTQLQAQQQQRIRKQEQQERQEQAQQRNRELAAQRGQPQRQSLDRETRQNQVRQVEELRERVKAQQAQQALQRERIQAQQTLQRERAQALYQQAQDNMARRQQAHLQNSAPM